MRVLAVDHTAGIPAFRRKFAALARRPGVELSVFAPNRWVENYHEVRLRVPRGVAAEGYRIRTGSVVWPGYENRGFFVSGLATAIREARPEILHLWEEPFGLIALQALWLRSVLAPRARALFFSADNLTRDGRYPYRPSWLYRRIERYAFRECVAGTAVSGEVVEVLRAKGYRGPIALVPNGLDLESFSEAPRGEGAAPGRFGADGPVIGYVGRLLRQKGVDTLLRAFAALAPSEGRPAPTLVVVGSGPDATELEALARELDLEGRARFLAGVPHDEMPAIYRGIDVLVVPSRTTPKWKEQFGRVLVEGMAAGCVVIGSSSGAIPEVLGDAGLVFPEGDATALRAALERALGEPGLAERLRARGRDRVRRRFTWDAAADTLLQLYSDMLEGAR